MGEKRPPPPLVAVGLCLLLLVLRLSQEAEGSYIKYNTRATVLADKLNVHLVPHSHDDMGWLRTVDQYYVGSSQTPAVKYILDSVVQELEADPNRRFSFVETGFFVRWWRQQSPAKKATVQQLVASGQLEFVNGGWCMHDEATTHYVDLIDQTTLGHRYLKDYFGFIPRNGWQIDPFGHSAVQAYLLTAEVGFDAMFAARIHHQDKEARLADKTLEMIWRGSTTLGASSQIFMGVFPVHYDPPTGFNFETDNSFYTPVQDDFYLGGYNIGQQVGRLLDCAQQQAGVTRTNNIMWTMGHDFTYQTAITWYSAMDKLIHHANIDGRVNVLYSTPTIYLESKHAANETWPLKIGDFFPYADGRDSYWTGYFTSRPALKGYVRVLSAYLQAARQLEFLVGRQSSTTGFTTSSLEEAMATVQHHDGVSGTSQQVVAHDYARGLYIGAKESEQVINTALEIFTGCRRGTFQQCELLNVSYCPATETVGTARSIVVVVYNPLAWSRVEYIRLPVSNGTLTVKDSAGNVVESQIIPISNTTTKLRNFYVQANLGMTTSKGPYFDLLFPASIPPLGFTSYLIGPSSSLEPASGTAVESIVESTDQVRNSTEGAMKIGNGILQLVFNSLTGNLANIVTNQINTPVTQTNLYYETVDFSSSPDGATQTSGAYVFRPATSIAEGVNQHTDMVNNTVVRGPLVEEVWQEFSPWVSQVMRVYKGQEHVEVEFTIGPIPDDVGMEVITRLSTNIQSNKVFYTDSNGRDFIQRVRDHSGSWNLTVEQPIAGNYYPINLGMYIADDDTELSVLVDRAVGGASIVDGQVELMLHRRLQVDDGKGVDEPLNEFVCLVAGDFTSNCLGLTIRGRYFLSMKTKADAAAWRRTQGQAIFSPPVLAFVDAKLEPYTSALEFSSMAPNTSLPANVALLTLQELESGFVLLRLAHLYQANEHPMLSQLATVDLRSLFSYGRRIINATEISLTANQEKSAMKKPLQWNVDGEGGGEQAVSPIRGATFDASSLLIDLGPMEIRTFLLMLTKK